MPRRRPAPAHIDSDSDEQFETPSSLQDATNYSFEYTGNSRIVNPNQPSTSRAARNKNYARKSTSAAPHGRNAPIRENLSNSQTVASSPERRSTRNQNLPRNNDESSTRNQDRLVSTNAPQNTQPKKKSGQAPQRQRKQKKPMSMQDRINNEIRKMQNRDGLMIPRAPFGRLLREIMMDASNEVKYITRTALEGLQEACETYLVQVLSDAYALTLHRGRVTLMPKDIQLLRIIRMIE